MSEEELEEYLAGLELNLEVNIDMLTEEKIEYYAACQYYCNVLLRFLAQSNRSFLLKKMSNIIISTNQLMYEADVEQTFWMELIKLIHDSNFLELYKDIWKDIDDLLTIFAQHAMYRYEFYNEYQEDFERFTKKGIICVDEYYLSDVDKQEYIDLIDNYKKKLLKTKK